MTESRAMAMTGVARPEQRGVRRWASWSRRSSHAARVSTLYHDAVIEFDVRRSSLPRL
ncbi:MAG: hypothetical protein JNK78_14315 [Planctomycetes bacterium]|nr:hypothetical protein [Planctomycetota bacterium]